MFPCYKSQFFNGKKDIKKRHRKCRRCDLKLILKTVGVRMWPASTRVRMEFRERLLWIKSRNHRVPWNAWTSTPAEQFPRFWLRKFSIPMALRTDSGWRPNLTKISDDIHWTHHPRQDSSERRICPTQRPLPDNTHPWRRWDLKPQSQQVSGRRSTPHASYS